MANEYFLGSSFVIAQDSFVRLQLPIGCRCLGTATTFHEAADARW